MTYYKMSILQVWLFSLRMQTVKIRALLTAEIKALHKLCWIVLGVPGIKMMIYFIKRKPKVTE
jgi:hypothetical protein